MSSADAPPIACSSVHGAAASHGPEATPPAGTAWRTAAPAVAGTREQRERQDQSGKPAHWRGLSQARRAADK